MTEHHDPDHDLTFTIPRVAKDRLQVHHVAIPLRPRRLWRSGHVIERSFHGHVVAPANDGHAIDWTCGVEFRVEVEAAADEVLEPPIAVGRGGGSSPATDDWLAAGTLLRRRLKKPGADAVDGEVRIFKCTFHVRAEHDGVMLEDAWDPHIAVHVDLTGALSG